MEVGMERMAGCSLNTTFISKGCQRRPNCLSWSKSANVIAFASAGDVCFAVPEEGHRYTGIESTVNAHDTPITCLKFVSWYQNKASGRDYFVTAAADGSVRLWGVRRHEGTAVVTLIDNIGGATGRPVSYCAGAAISDAYQDVVIIAYAIPDRSLVVEQVTINRKSMDRMGKQSYEMISFKPAFVVSIAIHIVSNENVLFILGTTDNTVEVVSAKYTHKSPQLRRAITLRGHADWICSIDVRSYGDNILIASAGQDNVIRIWCFATHEAGDNSTENEIQLKTFSLTSSDEESGTAPMMHVTLQAVLNAHDDWIYSVEWHPNKLQLMSASNDKTIIIWEPTEVAAGLWLDKVRVGDVGGQAVGFLGACFSPEGTSILAYSYFGGFFSWQLEKESADGFSWKSIPAFGGHSGQVKDIAWDPTGSYLLSCSFDQTTRCYAPCREQGMITEIARPQVHGYDLNCITSLSSSRFVSGADEKILRVFTVPRNFVQMLSAVSKYDCEKLFPNPTQISEHNATVPALGLSNKVMDDLDIAKDKEPLASGDGMSCKVVTVADPGLPTEENLMQNTLWPEIQKLYGHGFEVYSVASNHAGTLCASACKASRVESAAILIWDSEQWRRRCELQCHKLTVVQLAFSNNDSFLLSVSRDRTFCISARSSENPYDWKILLTSEKKYSKVHSRIVWCCAWSPDDKYFATGARDKKLCLWRFDGNDIKLVAETKHSQAVTAVDFVPKVWNRQYLLAVAFENGELEVEKWDLVGDDIRSDGTCLKRWPAHSETINRLRFRPKEGSWLNEADFSDHVWELASASNDNSIKVHRLTLRL